MSDLLLLGGGFLMGFTVGLIAAYWAGIWLDCSQPDQKGKDNV